MNRELRPTRSVQQLKDEQVNLMFEEIEKDIENIKLVISEKDKQLRDLKNTVCCKSWLWKSNRRESAAKTPHCFDQRKQKTKATTVKNRRT